MTSRETTGFLPRSSDEIPARSFADWAWQLGIGAVQWPWLLKSLHGGSKAEKRRLLDRLDLPADALPNLGSWKADTGLLHLVVDHILENKPRRVVEFGAGASSLVIAAALRKAGGGEHIGFDQHKDFVAATRHWLSDHGLSADLRYAPLIDAPAPWPGVWYDTGPLPDNIDLMLVDGPPWTIHPLTRGSAETLFAKLASGGTILLDDAARPGERIVAGRWKAMHPEMDFRLWSGGTKGTLIGTRRR